MESATPSRAAPRFAAIQEKIVEQEGLMAVYLPDAGREPTVRTYARTTSWLGIIKAKPEAKGRLR
jgi:hypothetical protein